MVVKVKEEFENIRNVKNYDKSKRFILRGERNVIHYAKLKERRQKHSFTKSCCLSSKLSSKYE